MWIYVYDAGGGSGSSSSGTLSFPFTINNGPITGAVFASADLLLPPVPGDQPGWYWLNLPPNSNFSCAAGGYNTLYTNTNGYTQMAIGLQRAGGK